VSEQYTQKVFASSTDGLFTDPIKLFNNIEEVRAWAEEHTITSYVFFDATEVVINDSVQQ